MINNVYAGQFHPKKILNSLEKTLTNTYDYTVSYSAFFIKCRITNPARDVPFCVCYTHSKDSHCCTSLLSLNITKLTSTARVGPEWLVAAAVLAGQADRVKTAISYHTVVI